MVRAPRDSARPLPTAETEGHRRAVGGWQRGRRGWGGRPLSAAQRRQRPSRPRIRRGAAPRAAGPRRHLGRCPGSGTGRAWPGRAGRTGPGEVRGAGSGGRWLPCSGDATAGGTGRGSAAAAKPSPGGSRPCPAPHAAAGKSGWRESGRGDVPVSGGGGRLSRKPETSRFSGVPFHCSVSIHILNYFRV